MGCIHCLFFRQTHKALKNNYIFAFDFVFQLGC
jgi:hypothetical protein